MIDIVWVNGENGGIRLSGFHTIVVTQLLLLSHLVYGQDDAHVLLNLS